MTSKYFYGYFFSVFAQITSLTEDRENLLSRQHELESSISELQRRLGM